MMLSSPSRNCSAVSNSSRFQRASVEVSRLWASTSVCGTTRAFPGLCCMATLYCSSVKAHRANLPSLHGDIASSALLLQPRLSTLAPVYHSSFQRVTWYNVAPTPIPEASDSTQKGFIISGNPSIGADTNADRKAWNAFS
ncbi:hypothetical protein Pelo_19673 [Pelomyxa schiedti]|nr:hypothetical protein Pelo_19673 [Pelomyxa schiedti]